MKQIYLIISCWMMTCLVVQAQDVNDKKWTLEECINYAIAHNIDIKKLGIAQQNAEIQVNTAKSSRLPDLNAGIGQNWSFGRSLSESNIYVNRTISNSSLGVSSSTPIFTGFSIPNEIKRSKLNLEAATQNLEKAKEDLALNIASLFLKALFNNEILKVSKEQLTLSLGKVERTQYLVEVGKVPASQLFDIKADVAKDEANVIEANNNLQLSLLDLAQSLELERSTTFDIQIPETEEIVENNVKSIIPPDLIYDYAVSFKPVIKVEEFKLESTKKSLKIAEAGYMPKIDLSLRYNNGYYYSYNNNNLSFNEQIKNNGGEVIALNMNIPIFNRFSVRNKVRSAKLSIQDQQLTLENTKKALYKEIQTAYLNATATQEKYRASTKAVEASQESFKYAEERYQIGKSTVFEFNEARTKLIQSLSEQIKAKYDYIFSAKILDFYNGTPITL